ncbi:probable ATP-dependent RNA helicase DDX10 [Drosophila grimshawi]|uniref:ATP-dependent RNA helicase n=1 Tax=Drosophila grimshawi TaxID=7222 RepID=B4JNF6_DROGR|nr:probable ATP-dependent RNA helicase DDX10 [Drosophila grimshawi]EDV92249.1 GH24149 [Drosophila grimshawi]
MHKQRPGGSGKPGPQKHKQANSHKKSINKKRSKEISRSKLAATDSEIQELRSKYDDIDASTIKTFAQFPLSQKTQKALAESKFITATEVQRQSIGPALQGKDVLGAAITGSGKTLAFLIPVLEHLYMNKWSRSDGVGAIIISPTRELAYQIFETLKKVGKHHDFSAGLIIGGKNLKFERTRMDQCNILICTPGRLLQHMDENPLFNTSTMEMLVLDEADRCLDMGFQKTLNAIIENFPPDRQTLLFSATQTNTLEDLARLNLQQPVYVGYGTANSTTTPASNAAVLALPELLQQSYVVLPLEEKITMLWSFIKNHLKQKIIVFVASCKQAKYLYEIFCKLRPGVGLLALYGTLHQDKRIAIYEEFLRKSQVVMFATDVASRGLDFPAVNWVLQLDCPEDVSQYIHRAGRSARNKSHGECLLVMTPNEEEHMIGALREQLNVEIKSVHIDPKKLFSPRVKIEAFLAQFPELRASAQRAFLAYLKSVFLMRNKRLFNVLSLDLDAYAQSLGLAVTPRVPFIEKLKWRQKQQEKKDDLPAQQTTTSFGGASDHSDVEDDDFINIKRRDHDVEGAPVDLDRLSPAAASDEEDSEELLVVPKREKLVTKAALAKKALKKNLQINNKLKFDEDGQTLTDERNQMKALTGKTKKQKDDDGGINLMLSKALLNEEDQYDKQRFRELVKKRHKLQRMMLRKKAEEQSDEEQEEEDHNEDQQPDDMDSDSEQSVDLSWLPDPDKLYKKRENNEMPDHQNDDNDDEEDDDDDNVDDDNDEPVHKKSKITQRLTLLDSEAIVTNLLASYE